MTNALLNRIVEPELMDDSEQALAYHSADFSESHGRRVEIFRECFPNLDLDGCILDLGCGSGDIIFRFANAFPKTSIVGVDGSQPMIDLAKLELRQNPKLKSRFEFVTGFIPGADIPHRDYQLVMSHSFLHHLHEPGVLWQTVKEYATAGTAIFVADLRRPSSAEEARAIVENLAHSEAEILQRDFYNSLCAAFHPDEIRRQLDEVGLTELTVKPMDDNHLVVYGYRR